MITGYHSVETAVKLVSMGASDYITKPFNVDLIKVTVAKIMTMSHAAASAPRQLIDRHLRLMGH